jgi:rieske iron-sulfur protein
MSVRETSVDGTERPPTGAALPDAGTRRQVLKWLIRLGYVAFAAAFGLPALALKSLSQKKRTVDSGDRLVYAVDGPLGMKGTTLKTAELAVGMGVQVFPDGKADNQQNLIEVVRIAAGSGANSVVAYSAICTHLGCAVFAQLNPNGEIACPCHGSRYDPAHGAAVVGGPAPRPLPALPIAIHGDGTVTATGPFDGPIGP